MSDDGASNLLNEDEEEVEDEDKYVNVGETEDKNENGGW